MGSGVSGDSFREGTAAAPETPLPRVPLLLEGLSPRFLRESRIVPLELRDGVLKVLMADPADGEALAALQIALDARVEPRPGDALAIDDYLARHYGPDAQDLNRLIETIDPPGGGPPGGDGEDAAHLKGLAAEAPIVRLVDLLITRALEGRASDIHIEPFDDGLSIRFRIDGVLHEVERAPRTLQAALVSRIKVMARLDIAERRLPQDGRIRLKAKGREVDLRVSTLPVLHGESVVLRILDREGALIDLDRLGLPGAARDRFQRLTAGPNGIVLVTGPTGSGKTTTLYGALARLNTPAVKIVTVEDPVEVQLRGVNQIQVKPAIGLTFAAALRHIVRQDPDIILIGEIRDRETAQIAVQSALTGHLVLATLHTNDAPGAVTRLTDLGVEPFLLASTLRGVLAQRLVRRLCPHCRRPDPDPATAAALAGLGQGGGSPCRAVGCDHCLQTGFLGRTGIFELLVVDDATRRLILAGADAAALREEACRRDMGGMLADGAAKTAAGLTTLPEVLRVTREA